LLISFLFTLLISIIITCLIDGRSWVRFESISVLTPQTVFACISVILLSIFLMTIHQLLRGLSCFIRSKNYFLDRCCIEQINEEEKLKELRLIPNILSKSDQLVVLLNNNYLLIHKLRRPSLTWYLFNCAVQPTPNLRPLIIPSTSVRLRDACGWLE
jgi:hypothetical protein